LTSTLISQLQTDYTALQQQYTEMSARFTEEWPGMQRLTAQMEETQLALDAEKLRIHLLDEHGVGLIATSATDIRVAFSCLEAGDVEPLFEALHQAIQQLR